MYGHRCMNPTCNTLWVGDTGPEGRFWFITHFCPDCLSRQPIMELPPQTGPSWHGHLPGNLPGEKAS